MDHIRQSDQLQGKASSPAPSRVAPATEPAQARPGPGRHKTADATPAKASAPLPRVERPAAGTAPIEHLAIAPRSESGDGTIEFDWEPVALGTNRSFTCTVTTDPSNGLSVTLEQEMYRRSFDGQGALKITVIPPAPASTRGSLTARNLTTGAAAVFVWQWEPSSSVAGSAPPKPAGLLGRLFGRAKPATVAAARNQRAKTATVAERLFARAPLAVSLRFFGQEAVGQRFAFVLDRSGSMAGKRWKSCTKELVKALRSMPEHAEFFVVLFSNHHIDANQQLDWMPAERTRVEEVITWLGTVSPGGGTLPASAFERVFSLPSPPDVIYFLTDGEVGGFTPSACANLRGSAPTIVNTIALENDASSGMLREMAEASGGQFILVPDAGSTDADD